MLETMLALKNNDMRKIPGYDPEPVEKLRKLQRTLVSGFHNRPIFGYIIAEIDLDFKCTTHYSSCFCRSSHLYHQVAL